MSEKLDLVARFRLDLVGEDENFDARRAEVGRPDQDAGADQLDDASPKKLHLAGERDRSEDRLALLERREIHRSALA